MFLKFLGNRELNVTLPEFMVSKFKTKIKVARKSHIKEAASAVLSFKKTLVKSAKKPPIS